jgi:hypothetical protein
VDLENINFVQPELKVDENGDQFYVWNIPETDYVLTLKVPVQKENVMKQ